MPSASKKRRAAATPVASTPRRTKALKKDTLPTETSSSVKPQSSARRRGRPPKLAAADNSSDAGAESTAAKRGRRRRQAFVPEELEELAEEAANFGAVEDIPIESENEIELVNVPDDNLRVEAEAGETVPVEEHEFDDASDIWMATLSDKSTPRASLRLMSDPVPAPADAEDNSDDTSSERTELQLPDADPDNTQLRSDASVETYTSQAEPQPNDTIAHGEDFSMIFMESLPSLRASLTERDLLNAQEDFGEEASLIINRTLESLRHGDETAMDLSTHEDREDREELDIASALDNIPEEVDAEPTRNHRVGAANMMHSTPSPLRPRQGRNLPKPNGSTLRRRASRNAAKAGIVVESLCANVETVQSPSNTAIVMDMQEDSANLFEDSFSEIPTNVLDAATPRRQSVNVLELAHDLGDESEEDIDELEDDKRGGSPSHETDDELLSQGDLQEEHVQDLESPARDRLPPSVASTVSRNDATRLPTPDDTPPYSEEEAGTYEKSLQTSDAVSLAVESPLHLSSSKEITDVGVPQITEPFANLEASSPLAVDVSNDKTPAHLISSPLQDPMSLQPELLRERIRGPTLSPIVRAGLVLQSVTSDPPSPEPTEKQLGSPFRTSTSKNLISHLRQLRAASQTRPSPDQSSRVPPASISAQEQREDDPFNSYSPSAGQTGFMKTLTQSLTKTTGGELRQSRNSVASSMRISPPAEEMSWIADAGPISPRLRGDNTLQNVVDSSNKRQTDKTVNMPDQDVHTVETEAGEDSDDTQAPAEDETDIWEFEAQRETPRRQGRQKPFGKKAADSLVKKTPSFKSLGHIKSSQPGLGQDIAATHSNEVVSASMAPSNQMAGSNSVREEPSMLGQAEKRSNIQSRTSHGSTGKARGFDLSSFFSSPAEIPSMLAAKTKALFGAREAERSNIVRTVPAGSTGSMFPPLLEERAVQNMSSRRSSVSSIRTDIERADMHKGGPEGDKLKEPMNPRERSLPSPTREMPRSNGGFKATATLEPPSPGPSSRRQALTKLTGMATPPRMQLSHADIHRWQQATSNAEQDDSPRRTRPLLRPLPPKNASPIKSNLRSPLKPKTPGPVVEFTSSVLSPVEQAQARRERRLSNSTAASALSVHSVLTVNSEIPGGQEQQQQQQVISRAVQDNKENQNMSDVTMTDASPIGKSQSLILLSQNNWSKQHWLLLDDLLQARRRGAFDIDYEQRSETYLGKTVKSQGEALRLERWHLDCVDAFKSEVGGWDEGVLVKRLFALLLGEERRRRGHEERTERVMFH